MYCRENITNQFQFMSRPYKVQNTRSPPLLQLLSYALKSSFGQFCYHERTLQANLYAQAYQKTQKAKKCTSDVIEIFSDSEIQQEQNTENKNVLTLNLNMLISKAEQDLFGQDKEDDKKTCSKTLPASSPSLQRDEVGHQISGIEIMNEKESKMDIEEEDLQFIQFEIGCPTLGVSNARLLHKKQSLLSRQVKNWSQVPTKGSKQRREIRMLQN